MDIEKFINENTMLNEMPAQLFSKNRLIQLLNKYTQALQLQQSPVSGSLPAETLLKWIDDFVPCYVTECCGVGPIITENYCPKCGKKIIRQ